MSYIFVQIDLRFLPLLLWMCVFMRGGRGEREEGLCVVCVPGRTKSYVFINPHINPRLGDTVIMQVQLCDAAVY